jgi:adenylyltransferase/sulfurtransferase
MNIPEITVQELQALKNSGADFCLLDVRNADENAACNLGGLLIPLAELPQRLDELNPNQQTIVHCQSGGRSSRAVAFLLEKGFKDVRNLQGGIRAWAREIDPKMPI